MLCDLSLRATSHTSQELSPWNCESPNESVQRPLSQHTHLQNHLVRSQTLECSVRSYVTGPSTKCYFNGFLLMRVLTHYTNRINQWLWAYIWSAICSQFVFRLTPKRWLLKLVQVTMNTWSIQCHVGIHVDFTSILPFAYYVSPSSLVWSELGPAPRFSTNEVQCSRALSLMCEVALNPRRQRRMDILYIWIMYPSSVIFIYFFRWMNVTF
jgi:hypothetical protein